MRTSPITGRRKSHHPASDRSTKPASRLTVVSHSDRVGLLSDCEKALRNICRRARGLTGATGAAIAVGSAEAMYCRTTSGATAPSLGSRLDTARGLSGQCVQSGEVLLCIDTQNDPRVDAGACNQLGVRSVLVVPLEQNNEVLGIFEILSSKPNAFTDAHVQEMTILAREILYLNVPRSMETQVLTRDTEPARIVDGIPVPESVSPQGDAVLLQSEASSEVTNVASIGVVHQPDQLALAVENAVIPRETYTSRSWSRPAIAVVLLLAGVFAYQWRAIHFRAAPATATSLVTETGTPPQPEHPSESKANDSVHQTQPSAMSQGQPGQVLHSHPATQSVDIVAMDVNKASAKIKGELSNQDLETTRVAAEAGDTNAEYQMGLRYANGSGVPQNYAEAMNWFERAANNGSPTAQWRTGLGYAKGIGVVQDERTAAEWFKKAANQAHIGAQLALSDLYLNGRGVPKDYVRAYTWASIARGARDGEDNKLKSMESRMTPSEIRDAQQRIAAWWGRRVPSSGSQ